MSYNKYKKLYNYLKYCMVCKNDCRKLKTILTSNSFAYLPSLDYIITISDNQIKIENILFIDFERNIFNIDESIGIENYYINIDSFCEICRSLCLSNSMNLLMIKNNSCRFDLRHEFFHIKKNNYNQLIQIYYNSEKICIDNRLIIPIFKFNTIEKLVSKINMMLTFS